MKLNDEVVRSYEQNIILKWRARGNNMTSAFLLFLHIFCGNVTQACQQNMVSIFKFEMFIFMSLYNFFNSNLQLKYLYVQWHAKPKTTSSIFLGTHFSCYSPEPFKSSNIWQITQSEMHKNSLENKNLPMKSL